MNWINAINEMDCLKGLSLLPDNSVQVCVTSPPYWGLRNYGVSNQVGAEETPEKYVEVLTELFEQVRRVLKPDGTLWLNLGDVYWDSGKVGKISAYAELGKSSPNLCRSTKSPKSKHAELKSKDLIGLPWMVAFALRKKGWWLRQEIIWHKLNCLPESVRDRCTRAHEHIFMFSKSKHYYYNGSAIKTKVKSSSAARIKSAIGSKNKYSFGIPGTSEVQSIHRARERNSERKLSEWVNRRSIWPIGSKPFKGDHFAVFPSLIPELCIKAGSRLNDIILDPFMGAGTTALAAVQLNRRFTGFELNPLYIKMANKRLRDFLGLFYSE